MWIWGPFIPTKRSMVIWRLIHGKLPTWDYIRYRGFSGPSKCVFCYSAKEDLDHLFNHCPWTQSIISKVSSVFNVHFSFKFGFGYWLLQACRCDFSPQVAALWRLCITTIIWVIWDQRNRRIFEGLVTRDSSLLIGFRAFILEASDSISAPMRNTLADLAITSACGVKGRPPWAPTVKCVRWQTPPVGVLKKNIDGSAAGSPGQLTGWGVFRDHFGVFRGCFTVSHGSGYAFEAELATTLYAIELVHDKGWSNIWLESDSSYVVHILKSSHFEIPWRLLARWHRVRRLRPNLNMVVSHIYREGNAVADRLSVRRLIDSCGGRLHQIFFSASFRRTLLLIFIASLRFRGVPFSLTVDFVPKGGFPVARFLMGPRPLNRFVVLWH
ncbi:hypothetical protein ACS0TY_027491 [Phlomoides rotata]